MQKVILDQIFATVQIVDKTFQVILYHHIENFITSTYKNRSILYLPFRPITFLDQSRKILLLRCAQQLAMFQSNLVWY